MEDENGSYEALFTRSSMEQSWCCFLRGILCLLDWLLWFRAKHSYSRKRRENL